MGLTEASLLTLPPYTTDGAADFYSVQAREIAGLMSAVLKSTPANASLGAGAIGEEALCDALGAKLYTLINYIQADATTAQKCSDAIAAIRNGQGSTRNILNTLCFSSISGTITAAEIAALIKDSLPIGVSESDLIAALNAKASDGSFEIAVTINFNYVATN